MTSHSKWAPSKAYRWTNCSGSADLEAEIPAEKSSPWAREGTAAHLLCEARAKRTLTAGGLSALIGKTIGQVFPLNEDEDVAGIVVTAEMIDAVQEYDAVINSINPDLPRENVLIETKVHFEDTDVYGTADCIILDWPACMHVIDFKYGQGVRVEVEDNLQLIIYGCAAMDTVNDDFDEITLHIVQPRTPFGDSHTSWTLSRDQLDGYRDKIRAALRRTEDESDVFCTGAWCNWCTAATACPEVTLTLATIDSRVPVLSNDVIADYLSKESAVNEFYKRLKSMAIEQLSNGEKIPGYKLVEAFGWTTWKDEERVREILKEFPIELIEQRKLNSPNQMKTALKRSYPNELKEETIKPSKGLALAPESDKRPEVKRTSATDDFAD